MIIVYGVFLHVKPLKWYYIPLPSPKWMASPVILTLTIPPYFRKKLTTLACSAGTWPTMTLSSLNTDKGIDHAHCSIIFDSVEYFQLYNSTLFYKHDIHEQLIFIRYCSHIGYYQCVGEVACIHFVWKWFMSLLLPIFPINPASWSLVFVCQSYNLVNITLKDIGTIDTVL